MAAADPKKVVQLIRTVVKRAIQDVTLLRHLVNDQTTQDALVHELGADDAKALREAHPSIVFKSIEGAGYCLIPPLANTLVVVVTPSPEAIREEYIGTWPEGSSPETPGCHGPG